MYIFHTGSGSGFFLRFDSGFGQSQSSSETLLFLGESTNGQAIKALPTSPLELNEHRNFFSLNCPALPPFLAWRHFLAGFPTILVLLTFSPIVQVVNSLQFYCMTKIFCLLCLHKELFFNKHTF